MQASSLMEVSPHSVDTSDLPFLSLKCQSFALDNTEETSTLSMIFNCIVFCSYCPIEHLTSEVIFRIGTEHEKLGYLKDSKQRLPYTAIESLLWGICQKHKWRPIMEGDFIIGAEKDGQSVTIEPGGQFELSGAPVDTLHDTHTEVLSHIQQVLNSPHLLCLCTPDISETTANSLHQIQE